MTHFYSKSYRAKPARAGPNKMLGVRLHKPRILETRPSTKINPSPASRGGKRSW